MPAPLPSHLGLCTSDLERSLAFYCQGLGFVLGERFDIDRPIAETSGDVRLVSQFVHLGPLTLELLGFSSPEPTGTPSASRTQIGLTHLSFIVDDVDETAQKLVAAGGTVVPATRSGQEAPDGLQIIFVADPDGVRIELMGNVAPLTPVP
jgi:lactoylglutathione lyase